MTAKTEKGLRNSKISLRLYVVFGPILECDTSDDDKYRKKGLGRSN